MNGPDFSSNADQPSSDDQPTIDQHVVAPDSASMPMTQATFAAPQPPAARGNASRRNVLVGIVSAIIILAVVVGGVLITKLRVDAGSTPPTASQILTSASNVTLQDAAFSFTGSVGLTTQSTGLATRIDLNGTGAVTTTPQRAQATLQIPFLGAQNQVNVFVDGNDLYFKAPGLLSATGSADATKWFKVTSPTALTTTMSLATLYKQVQNPKLIGSDVISNQAAWHIQGTVAMPKTPATGSTTATPIPGLSGLNIPPLTIDLWITKDHYYPLQVQSQIALSLPAGALAGLPTPTAGGSSTGGSPLSGFTGVALSFSLLFTQWNTGAQLTPPAPGDVATGLPAFPTGNPGGSGFPGFPGQPTATPTA